MDQKMMFRQWVAMNKMAFEYSFNFLAVFQDQAERMTNSFFDKASWIPDDGKKLMNEWIKNCKTSRDHFKKIMDDSFNRSEQYFT